MRIAAQFYTLREFTKTSDGFRDALRRVAEIGYQGVQLSAVGAMDAGEVDAEETRALLEEYGLLCCATHRPLKRLVENAEEEIAFHRTLGCNYTAIGGAWEYPNTAEGYARLLGDLKPVIETLHAAGLRFGYHNHAHEFYRDPATRRPNYEILIAEPGLQLEVDTYWVAHAGVDPTGLLNRIPHRIACVHLKDMEVDEKGNPLMAPVGEGNLDWEAILGACRAGGTEWAIVEQDVCRRDPFDCLRSSYAYLAPKLL